MDIEEKKETCSKAFMAWFFQEQSGADMKTHDQEVMDNFSSKVILKKLEVAGVDVVLPDLLLIIFDICVEGNPGQIQLLTKELLMHIKKQKGSIPAGYVVTSMDFASLHMTTFPIMSIPSIYAKYENQWIAQKIDSEPGQSDNLCDTYEWWQEIYK